MRRDFFAKVALGCAGICMSGGLAGVGLANYTTSGSFEFYKQRPLSDWEPVASTQSASLQTTDLAFAADRRVGREDAGAEEVFASFDP